MRELSPEETAFVTANRNRLPSTSGSRYCVRCKAEVHGLPEDQPHLCADVKRRMDRRQRMVDAVNAILSDQRPQDSTERERTADSIVTKLLGMGIADADL